MFVLVHGAWHGGWCWHRPPRADRAPLPLPAAVFKDLVAEGLGWIAFLEVLTFIAVLMSGFAYVWARGDLQWTGPDSAAPNSASSAPVAPPVAQGEPLGARR